MSPAPIYPPRLPNILAANFHFHCRLSSLVNSLQCLVLLLLPALLFSLLSPAPISSPPPKHPCCNFNSHCELMLTHPKYFFLLQLPKQFSISVLSFVYNSENRTLAANFCAPLGWNLAISAKHKFCHRNFINTSFERALFLLDLAHLFVIFGGLLNF